MFRLFLLALVGLVAGATALVVGAIGQNGEAAVSGVVMLAIGGPSAALLWVQTTRESSGLRDYRKVRRPRGNPFDYVAPEQRRRWNPRK